MHPDLEALTPTAGIADVTMSGWDRERMRVAGGVQHHGMAWALIRSGVGKDAYAAWSALPNVVRMADRDKANVLAGLLQRVTHDHPGLPLRSGLGWAFVDWLQPVGPLDEPLVEEHIYNWALVDPALPVCGWLFWAAGFTAREASAEIAAGSVTPESLLVMAGLRGLPVPCLLPTGIGPSKPTRS